MPGLEAEATAPNIVYRKLADCSVVSELAAVSRMGGGLCGVIWRGWKAATRYGMAAQPS
ncbi:hypothethical protein (plasmid) [Ralstonia solanacearum CMR15]|nr:hypothethical protein [Ralstonia solanacearum CMR15]